MKKKIKDLTLDEINNLCEKIKICDDCPFVKNHKCLVYDIFLIKHDIGEIEVEVDE